MKKFYSILTILLVLINHSAVAQQLPNSQFEDWSGETFDGKAQPASWNYSNVTQFGFKFNFAHKETGHNGGNCIMMQDQALKVAGIGETSPGYISLGHPWVYIESLTKVDEATAGTYGGISWTYRPDTMAVWIKRTGDNAMEEDFHLLYYSWTGTSHADSYIGKNGKCTAVSYDDEESDIRQIDENQCGIVKKAQQVAEGWYRTRAVHTNWVQIKVPIYYHNNTIPEKMNVIFSASNYPNFRANSGLFAGNSLYVDDVELIYSSKIQQFVVNGEVWSSFDPNSSEIQYCSLTDGIKTAKIKALRGIGQLTNTRGGSEQFNGRELQGDEITIQEGETDKTPTIITVRAEDGSSETTYRIQFVSTASTNTNLSGIQIDDINLKGFNTNDTTYSYPLSYGTTQIPVVTATPNEEGQTITITQANSLPGTSTIDVTAPNHTTQMTYYIHFTVEELSDNTLKGIKIDGELIEDFLPTSSQSYTIQLPFGTTEWPKIEGISKYTEGAQTIQILYAGKQEKDRSIIHDGDTISVSVTTPGNNRPKVYQLIIKYVKSANALLKMIYVGGDSLNGFMPKQVSYQIALPVGTDSLPDITYEKGETHQTVEIRKGGLNATTEIIVTAQDGTTKKNYQLTFIVKKSSISTLNAILLNGDSLAGFSPQQTSYTIALPIGETEIPSITAVQADENEKVSISVVGLKAYIVVKADDGSSTVYQLQFSLTQSSNANLCSIMIGSDTIPNFSSSTLNYTYTLPKGTKDLPVISYSVCDTLSTVTTRANGVNGDYKITVKPQSGFGQTYTIRFNVEKSSDVALKMIYLNGDSLSLFHSDTLNYIDTVDVPQLPTITYTKSDVSQKVITQVAGNTTTLKVIAENGDTRTYTINFIIRVSTSTTLQMIYLNGDSLKGFDKETLTYDSLFLTVNKTCPTITVDKSAGQTVRIFAPNGAGKAQIIVTAGNGDQSTYLLTFVDTTITPIPPFEPTPTYIPDSDVTIQTILIDNVPLSNFKAAIHTYSLVLDAGSSMPIVSFVPKTPKQTITAGAISLGTFRALVTAENGDTASYSVQISIKSYSNALLKNIEVENYSLPFDPNQSTYEIVLSNEQELPNITYSTNAGQDVMFFTPNENEQQLIVTAEDGTQNIYTITYKRVQSNNALLKDILLDGESLPAFRSDSFNYVDTLAWRRKVVPVVNAIGSDEEQTITTYFSAVNGTTLIHVVAADGITTADYTIAFPVRKSSNVQLNSIDLIYDSTLMFNFRPEQIDYIVEVPHNAIYSPTISYKKAEQEQTVCTILRPLGQKNEFIVQAEDGSTRTYSIIFVRKKMTNRLNSIMIKELNSYLDLSDTTKRDFIVNLPYGTTSLTVAYTKKYSEQTVMVQPGDVYQPTILMVYAPTTTTPMVYTITPNLETQNPATLSGIYIDGKSMTDFNANRFSYIVKVSTQPKVTYTLASDANISILNQTPKHWKAEVSYGEYTNIYEIWFYYVNDQIPNSDFTEWTNCSTTTSGKKPVGWNTIADVLGTHTIWPLSYTPDGLVKQSDHSSVKLTTEYSGPGGGAIPGFITLGKVTGNWGVAGSSSFAVNGGITFRNTPDSMNIKYYNSEVKNNSQILYVLTGSQGDTTIAFTDSETQSTYKTLTFNLAEANKKAGEPTLLNIVLNSYYQVSGTIAAFCEPTMYVDYLRLGYNNHLTKVMVNGKEATRDGNSFQYITVAEDSNSPHLSFVGDVSDQAQKVVWAEPVVEGEYSIHRATIINYGEDGNSSIYTLDIKRPIDNQSTLKKLSIGKDTLDCSTGQEYTYTLTEENTTIPDVVPVLRNHLQTCTMTYADSMAIIQVKAENGNTQTYRIRFVTEANNDASLSDITVKGMTFNEQETTYSIDNRVMPEITIYKRFDNQTVSTQNGTIKVTTPYGAVQQYQINLQPTIASTSGQLTDILLNAQALVNFASDTYEYQQTIPYMMSFTRKDDADSVVYIRKADTLVWHIYGSEEHTYILTQPIEISSSTDLKGIYINGELIEGFDTQRTEYTIYSDTSANLTVIGAESTQCILINESNNVYSIKVTAEDKTTTATYQVQVTPTISTDATLSSILLNGDTLSTFQSTTTSYTIIIPAGEAKMYEPVIPSISYKTSSDHASVDVIQGKLGETTYINVTAQDGIHTQTYQLTFTAEPSHNAYLSMIAIQDQPLVDFDSTRTYYSVQLPQTTIDSLQWHSNDHYQTITQFIKGDIYIIRVVAQDGITTNDYWVQVYRELPSSDATLANIMLDGKDLSQFDTLRNVDLRFQAGLNRYVVYVPSSTTTLPNISAIAKIDGQDIQIRQDSMTIYIDVTAPDGINTNTYSLQFTKVLSSNTALQMIRLDNDSINNFQSDQYIYFYHLAIGQTNIPYIDADKSESTQSIRQDTTAIDSMQQQVVITVTAEDKVSTSQYFLLFSRTLSNVDTLLNLYDSVPLLAFSSDTFDYIITYPYDTLSFPDVRWDKGDSLQVVRKDTLEFTDLSIMYRITVTAENGNSNRYTVKYIKVRSSDAQLFSISINNKPLESFQPYQAEYIFALSVDESIDTISYTKGNDYQTVQVKKDTIIGGVQASRLTVIAQDSSQFVYTIYYDRELSKDSTLILICSNQDSINIAEQYTNNFAIRLKENEMLWPAISFEKKDSTQQVEVTYSITDSIVSIHVIAPDGKSQNTYTIHYLPYISDNALLKDLQVSGHDIHFEETNFGPYKIELDSLVLPTISYTLAEPVKQSTQIDTIYIPNADSTYWDITITIQVTAEDKVTQQTYTLQFTYSNPNILLSNIQINNQTLGTTMGFDQDFQPEVINYYITYPIGFDPDSFYTSANISAQAQNINAQITYSTETIREEVDTAGIFVAVSTCIHITVKADKKSLTYNIYQNLLLDSINRSTELVIADYEGTMRCLNEFDPNVYYYEYILSDTRYNAPNFELRYSNTNSRFAYANFIRDNDCRVVDAEDLTNYANIEGEDDPTYHLCYHAENGRRYIYKIKFRRSEIKRAQKAMEGDVLIQHIPGTYQIAVASLRANVVFALYDINGMMIDLVKIPESNPNSINTTTDGFGQTYFGHISDLSGCTILTLQPNKIYFWIFSENGKRKIKSGKIVITP